MNESTDAPTLVDHQCMVRALLDGKKTLSFLPVTANPGNGCPDELWPYALGDIIEWREQNGRWFGLMGYRTLAWANHPFNSQERLVRVSDDERTITAIAERQDIEIIRIQDIPEADAIAAGIGQGFQMNAEWPNYEHIDASGRCTLTQDSARMSFASYWDLRYADRRELSWKLNPWAWRVTLSTARTT